MAKVAQWFSSPSTLFPTKVECEKHILFYALITEIMPIIETYHDKIHPWRENIAPRDKWELIKIEAWLRVYMHRMVLHHTIQGIFRWQEVSKES